MIIGLLLALYLIKKVNIQRYKYYEKLTTKIIKIIWNKEKEETEEIYESDLVERIEELGYIPSQQDINKDKAA